MTRRLGMLVSFLCLLLSIATVVLWIRSYRVATSAGYYAIDKQLNQCRRYDLTVAQGGISVGHDRVTLAGPQDLDIWQRYLEADYQKAAGTEHSLYHLSISKGEDPSASRPFFLEAPWAAATTLSAVKRLGFWADHTNSGPSPTSLLETTPASISGPAGLRIYNLRVTARDSAELHLPIWSLTILLLLLGLPAISSLRRYAMRRRGFCRNCQYDLTGNLSGVCPECGTPTR